MGRQTTSIELKRDKRVMFRIGETKWVQVKMNVVTRIVQDNVHIETSHPIGPKIPSRSKMLEWIGTRNPV